jgi:UDP-2,3-diacylglucosamine hydrolase
MTVPTIHLPEGKRLYFASDFHLGLPNEAESLVREKRIIQWLQSIQHDAHQIYLVGDLFDVWFEYKSVVPKGFVRLLGQLATLKDQGIDIFVFSGNHDTWYRDYFPQYLGIPVHHEPIHFICQNKYFVVGHGDGLGPGDKGYKLLKKIIRNPFLQVLYRFIHPDIGMRIATWFSRKGPKNGDLQKAIQQSDLDMSTEWLAIYSKACAEQFHANYCIFGHRHVAIDYAVTSDCRYINLGDWIVYDTYAYFDGKDVTLQSYSS